MKPNPQTQYYPQQPPPRGCFVPTPHFLGVSQIAPSNYLTYSHMGI